MIKINDISCDNETYFGLRGSCLDDPDSGRYIDDLPGINIVNFADTVDGILTRPEDLLKKCTKNAMTVVKGNFLGLLPKNNIQFKSVIGDASIKLAGSFSFYGEVNEFVSVLIEKYGSYCHDKFLSQKAFDFEIVSDRYVKNKKFYVQTDYDLKSIQVNLKAGRNRIPINVESDSEFIRIYFDVCNFKIGRRENYTNYTCGCMKCCTGYGRYNCSSVSCETSPEVDGVCNWTSTDTVFGFNLCVQCKGSKCKVFNYYLDTLIDALWYQTGIQYLMEVKSTTRVNAYVRNSTESIDALLMDWNGGLDVTTGIKHHSKYWKALIDAVDQIKYSLPHLSKAIVCDGSRVVNSLPA